MKLNLNEDSVNDIVIETMLETFRQARHSNHVDIRIRINGEYRWFEADWIKYIEAASQSDKQV